MEPGVYKRVHPATHPVGRSAAFVDRDGVVIEDSGYLSDPRQVRFIDGSLQAISRLNSAGIAVVVVTNQSGVGRGYYTWADFERVQSVIESELAAVGAWLDGTWACACHDEGVEPYLHSDHPFRKPNPGMLLDAGSQLQLSMARSWMIGDRLSDLEAGLRAGVHGVILIGPVTDSPSETDLRADFSAPGNGRPIHRCRNLAEAVDLISTATPHSPPAGEVSHVW